MSVSYIPGINAIGLLAPGLAASTVRTTIDVYSTAQVDDAISDAIDAIDSGGIGGSTGSTDNRVLRSDGTGGATLQASPVTIDDSGNVTGVAGLSTVANSGSGTSAAVVQQNGLGRVLQLIRNNGGASQNTLECLSQSTTVFFVNRDGFVNTTQAYSSSRYNSPQYQTGNEASTGWGSTGFNSKVITGWCDSTVVATFSVSGLALTNLTASGTVSVGTYTVSTLPSAAANAGRFAQVTDSNSTTNGNTVAGGGSNRVPVFSDGTNWIIK
jgi:hypothetical protein